MAKFKQGDVVVLKSDGPEMTVNSYHRENETKLTCTWFQNGELKSASFEEDTLDLAE